MTALYIALIVLAVIMLILLIPIDCVIEFSYNNNENNGSIIVKYLFLKFKILPAEKEIEEAAEKAEEEEPPKDRNVVGTIKLIKTVYSELKRDISRIVNHLFEHTIRIKELNISSKFGLGEPMYTGIALGSANALVYNLVSAADRHTQLDKWNVSIDADFDNVCLAAGVYIKIRTRILFVLRLGLMAAVLLLKIQRISRRMKNNG